MSPRLREFLGPDLLIQDRLRIFMHPQQLVLLRIKRTNTQHILNKKVVPCLAAEMETDDSQPNWMLAASTLARVLQDEIWQNAKPQVVLSNHFVRYALVPWHEGLTRRDERQAYLRHSFQLAYGDSVKGWDLRMSDNRLQHAALASGIEQGLLLHMQQTFEGLGLKGKEIYPHLMVAINQLRQQADCYAYWFVLVEKGKLCIALVQDGHWRSVKTYSSEDEITLQIAALIDRESVICGINTSGWPVLIYWPGNIDNSVQLSKRKVVWIRPVNLEHLQAGAGKHYQASQLANMSQDNQQFELAMWA